MKPLLLFIVLLMTVLAISIGAAEKTVAESAATVSWPNTDATICLAEARLSGTPPRYHPVVEYSYMVSQKEYRGNKIRLLDDGYGSEDRDWAQSRIARYKNDALVKVFYDPKAPSNSLLEVKTINLAQAFPTWGLGAAFFVLVLVMKQILVIAPRWVFVIALSGLFVLWVWFLITMRPE